MEYDFLKFKPSVVACSAWVIAKMGKEMTPERAWTKGLEEATHYTLEQLRPCMDALVAWKKVAESKGFSLANKKYFNINNI